MGQRAYTWHLTFTGHDELHRLARQYQGALVELPQVDPVPVDWLHMTMQGVGFTTEVSADELTRIVDAVRPRLAAIPAADLTFAQPIVFPEAIILAPEPAEPVDAIRGAICAGIADVWGKNKVPEAKDGFRAHVSIGYINRAAAAAPIIDAVHRHEPEPATVTIRATSLIELQRDHGIYQWRTVEDVPLGR